MIREDLLELTPEALTALANAGFVKRAQKDIAAGLLPRLDTAEDGTVAAHFDDGVVTRLPPGRTLRDAACTCPAGSMCRHRVMLVLAYQARHAAATATASAPAQAPSTSASGLGPEDTTATAPALHDTAEADAGAWTPARFDDAALAASFAPSVLAQAARLAAARPVIAVQPWRAASVPPAARLPMCSVRFFSRRSLVHARCDCKQGTGCAHVVLAVWAFRDAEALAPAGAPEVMVAVRPRGDDGRAVDAAEADGLLDSAPARAARAQLEALLLAVWMDGSGQPLLALSARVEALRAQVQALGWRWVDDGIDELWQLLQAQQARSSRFDAQRLLAVMAELWARPCAAGHAELAEQAATGRATPRPPLHASQILGVGVQGEVALDHLRLVSLGAALWSDETADGADVLFADPDTQAVTVLERRWPRAADAAAGGAAPPLASRRVAGFPLRQVAAGQVITKTATRRANGLIDIGAGARQTGVMPLSPTAWDELVAPLRQGSVAGLVAQLAAALPDFATPRQAAAGAATGTAGQLHVLAFERMAAADVQWDAAAQALHADLFQAPALDAASAASDDDTTGEGDDATVRPVDGLRLTLPHRAASPGAVDALARALAGEWGALRAVAGIARLRHGRAVMEPLALLTVQRAVVLQIEAPAPQPLALRQATDDLPALALLASDTLGLLAQWLRQGLRHQSASHAARVQAQADRLAQAGLTRCAALLRALPEDLRAARQPALVGHLATLGLLLQGVVQQA
ncbi:MAG: hypothetical protein EOP81_19680 [Variovorax sp.]|nr:MAG: hypothetical protein EOP81_19680 [Variovorax sp.]